jgi:hypothetical protein
MPKKNLVLFTVAVAVFMAFVVTPIASTQNENGRPPSSAQIAFAQQASDLLLNELLAALFKEFDETTPQNAGQGKQAISLVFNDLNRDMRLVGTFQPLGGDNDLPSDGFENTALSLALTGQPYTAVQQVNDTWYYRRSVPLSNTFHQSCVICHTNFTQDFFNSTNNPGQWVGALMLRVPIKTGSN